MSEKSNDNMPAKRALPVSSMLPSDTSGIGPVARRKFPLMRFKPNKKVKRTRKPSPPCNASVHSVPSGSSVAVDVHLTSEIQFMEEGSLQSLMTKNTTNRSKTPSNLKGTEETPDIDEESSLKDAEDIPGILEELFVEDAGFTEDISDDKEVLENSEDSPSLFADAITSEASKHLEKKVKDELAALPEKCKNIVAGLLSGLKDPREKLLVMNKTVEHGTIKVRNSEVAIIGGYIWKLAIPGSPLEKLVLNYSTICKHSCNKSYFPS